MKCSPENVRRLRAGGHRVCDFLAPMDFQIEHAPRLQNIAWIHFDVDEKTRVCRRCGVMMGDCLSIETKNQLEDQTDD